MGIAGEAGKAAGCVGLPVLVVLAVLLVLVVLMMAQYALAGGAADVSSTTIGPGARGNNQGLSKASVTPGESSHY